MVMYGSTIFLIQCMSAPASSPALWATAGVEPGTFSLAAGMATGGLAVTWLRGILGDPPWDEFMEQAGEVPPGSRGLLFLPYLAGERTPIFDPGRPRPAARADARARPARTGARRLRGHRVRREAQRRGDGVRRLAEHPDRRRRRRHANRGPASGGDRRPRSRAVDLRPVGRCELRQRDPRRPSRFDDRRCRRLGAVDRILEPDASAARTYTRSCTRATAISIRGPRTTCTRSPGSGAS